jgi:hypothetical protein
MNELMERYEKKFLRNDLLACLILMLAIFLLDKFRKWDIFGFVSPVLDIIFSTVASGGLTVFLFLLTCISIIIAFLQNKKLELLADSEQPITIMKTFFSALRWFGVLTIVSFFSQLPWNCNIKNVLFWLTVVLFSISIVRLMRTIWVVKSLAYLLIILKEPKK